MTWAQPAMYQASPHRGNLKLFIFAREKKCIFLSSNSMSEKNSLLQL